MIKGDKVTILGHDMEVVLRKESLINENDKMVDLVRYDLICTCCSYPSNLVMEITEKDLNELTELEYRMEGLEK